MSKKLFVGGLSWDTTDESLKTFFEAVGTVEEAVIIRDRDNRSKGFGFVTMDDAGAESAKTELNGKELDGRAISVSDARPMQPRNNFRS